jgi:hypothetical protein
MSDVVRRVAAGLAGAELSEARLQEVIDAINAAAGAAFDDAPGGGRRSAARLPVEGFALMSRDESTAADPAAPADPDAAPHFVGIYDLSRTGIAIVDVEPLAAGARFRVLVPRDGARRPIEVRCVARHCRRRGDGYVIGAAFGTSWVSAMGARVEPVG